MIARRVDPAAFRRRSAAPNYRAWPRERFACQLPVGAAVPRVSPLSHRGDGNGGVGAADFARRGVDSMSAQRLLERR